MRSLHRLALGVGALALLMLSGCGPPPRLKLDEKYTVEVGKVQQVDVDHLADKVSVTVKAPGSLINVHIVYRRYAEEAKQSLVNWQPVRHKIAGEDKIEEKTFEFSPERKPFSIMIVALRKAAQVEIKATGQ